MQHSQNIFLVMRSNHHITWSRISNDMNFFDNVKTFLFSLGNTMWLDPLVERTYLETINVTTNNLNIRMELLEEKLAADNKQVLISWERLQQILEFFPFFFFRQFWKLMVFDNFFTACATSKKLVRGTHLSATFGRRVKWSYRKQVLRNC